MTRFGLTQKALVNHLAGRSRPFPAESGNRLTESRQGRESLARDLPQNRRSWESHGAACGYFST
ncbi:msr7739 [Mesorhizobium japonicum MAFF 303099]|uniref:Msr7739 protein n=1 Tax=Mesorhizobium japonicum (strain LMG 29417 / CECT 9101 / MAFF 303099) TaxID=266835 RepID=Q985C4_RHILO|nr:msr7739 [Mesorhizobium japonicum MAFF 303099]